MRQMVGKILKAYGAAVTLCQGVEEYAVFAFFQPVRSKSWQYLEGNYSPLGEIPRGQFVYIGPVEPAAQAGDTVRVDGKAYLLRRSELVRDGNGPVYCWGMCVEKGGEDNWGRQS
ncbi:MAG: hypothetical protein IJ375_06840 [Oscillospiraceae bacterium]|nr:hypothetical protein [Oscillospiraceae bacterium]